MAALSDKRRFKFLKSPAPWIMTAVSFGVALPHLLWLEANDFVTFDNGVTGTVTAATGRWEACWCVGRSAAE